jgi:hypothetical protein
MSRLRLRMFPLYGAIIDLIVFCISFIFFGGAHGPAGPMFVLWVINRPIAEDRSRLIPFETTSNTMDMVLALGVLAVNGALYGLVAAIVVALWRAIFRKPRSI